MVIPLNGSEEVARLDFLVVAGVGGSVVGGSVGRLVWCTMGCVFTVVVTGAETKYYLLSHCTIKDTISHVRPLKNTRIYHKCEGRIEKSVWHQKACGVMTNGDPRDVFLSYPHTNNGFFILITTVFIYLLIYLTINFQKSLDTLRCNFT